MQAVSLESRVVERRRPAVLAKKKKTTRAIFVPNCQNIIVIICALWFGGLTEGFLMSILLAFVCKLFILYIYWCCIFRCLFSFSRAVYVDIARSFCDILSNINDLMNRISILVFKCTLIIKLVAQYLLSCWFNTVGMLDFLI